MPIYEYVCHSCGNEFEQLQGWSDGAPSCSACSSANVTRRLSPPAIHFKGSGWYITDSKNGQKGKNGTNGVAGSNGTSKEGDKDGGEEKSSAKEKASESGAGTETSGGSEAKRDTTAKKESSGESSKVKAAE